jgi:hypothetical protein
LSIIDRLCRRLVSANTQIRYMAQKTLQKSMLIALHVLSQREEGMGTFSHIRDELTMTFQCTQTEVDALVHSLVEREVLAIEDDEVVVINSAAFLTMAES